MRPSVTVWQPDTCGCEIEIRFDADLPAEERAHTFKTVKACPAHATVTEGTFQRLAASENLDAPAELAAHRRQGKPVKEVRALAALDDNRLKNVVYARLKDAYPDMADDEYEWSFDAERKLTFGVRGRTVQAAVLTSLSGLTNRRVKYRG